MVDAYSKWPEVFRTKEVTSNFVIQTLQDIFSRSGKPKLIVTDNGRQFVSEAFTTYCRNEGIQHLTTAYYQPQSNGEAERFIDTLKRHLERITSGGEAKDPLKLFLQYYRSTPNKTINAKTPAELFLGRKMRIDLDLLRPSERKPAAFNEKQNEQFDKKHAAVERDFAVGDLVQAIVYHRNKSKWADGQVARKFGDVPYKVIISDANTSRTIRSHANQLRRRYYKLPSSAQKDAIFDLLVDLGCDQDDIVPNYQPLNDDVAMSDPGVTPQQEAAADQPDVPVLRRSERVPRQPDHYGDWVFY